MLELMLVMLHTIDGHEVAINPKQVTSITGPREGSPKNKLFTDEVHCVIGMTDGRFVTTAENCNKVRVLLEKAK